MTKNLLFRDIPDELYHKAVEKKGVLRANTWTEFLAKILDAIPQNNAVMADGPPSDQLMPVAIQTVLEAKPKTKAQKFIGLVGELAYVNEIAQDKLEAMIRRICQVRDHRAVSNWLRKLEAQGKVWKTQMTGGGWLYKTYASRL